MSSDYLLASLLSDVRHQLFVFLRISCTWQVLSLMQLSDLSLCLQFSSLIIVSLSYLEFMEGFEFVDSWNSSHLGGFLTSSNILCVPFLFSSFLAILLMSLWSAWWCPTRFLRLCSVSYLFPLPQSQ